MTRRCGRSQGISLLVIKDLVAPAIEIPLWEIHEGEHWCLLGTTGSGKSRLAQLLADPKAIGGVFQQWQVPSRTIRVGFEEQQALFEAELRHDDTDFMDRIDQGRSGMELLLESGASQDAAEQLAARFGITPLLQRGYKVLSSGEVRKLLIARAILTQPDLLILDEPFDSLDADSRAYLGEFLETVKEQQHLLLMVSRFQDIQAWQSHVGVLHLRRLFFQGTRELVLRDETVCRLFQFQARELLELPEPVIDRQSFPLLVDLHKSRIRYGDTVQFQDFSWQLQPGEHTIVTGPNGAGKSTLLQMISGDHPQCFNNGVAVLGKRRGEGESIWEIKRHLGLVSGSLHQDYRVPGSVLSVVASGLDDTIGVYRRVPEKQKEVCRQWLAVVGLENMPNRPFRSLSWGEQRLVLIARALIKYPPLLLLDEPTLGLDDRNRFMVLACLERIAGLQISTLVFVSHREDEHLSLFRHRLTFKPDTKALYKIVASSLPLEKLFSTSF